MFHPQYVVSFKTHSSLKKRNAMSLVAHFFTLFSALEFDKCIAMVSKQSTVDASIRKYFGSLCVVENGYYQGRFGHRSNVRIGIYFL